MRIGARPRPAGAWLAALVALATGCVPLPVHFTPAVSGQVVDARSQQPIQGAVVVVRFDARHGDLLPDRDLLGHGEAVTDAQGRFRIAAGARPGLSAWPMVRTEVRLVSVIEPGYRCAGPHGVDRRTHRVTVRLEPAKDEADRRDSCRPIAARPSETPAYLAAWRALYPRDAGAGRMVDGRPLERLLEARRVFGPGVNCRGPAVDLSLSPGGERVAIGVEQAGRRRIEVVELAGEPRTVAELPVRDAPGARSRRLAWASGGELLLSDPAGSLDLLASGSAPGGGGGSGPQVVWRGPVPPARQDASASGVDDLRPVQAADLNDEGDVRWQGRSFQVVRSLDPTTGLASESLHTHKSEGEDLVAPLPGEPCGPAGQYGRPHYRITADPEIGVDLRYVDGGCHAVAIHLASGKWRRIDGAQGAGVCADTRRVPLPQLRAAMHGYVRDLEEALRAAGGDPGSAWSLRIGPDGRTTLESRKYAGGAPLELVVAPFPLETPLRRIDVTAIGDAGPALPPAPASPALQPL